MAPKFWMAFRRLNDDLLARHGESAFGKVHRNNHRQHLGRQPDRNGRGEQQRLQPVSLGYAIDQKHQGRHHQDERIISQVKRLMPCSKLVGTCLAEIAAARLPK